MSETPATKREAASASRRAFLLGAPALAAAATGTAQAADAPSGPKDRNDPVYRDTEHIRRFYQRSRF